MRTPPLVLVAALLALSGGSTAQQAELPEARCLESPILAPPGEAATPLCADAPALALATSSPAPATEELIGPSPVHVDPVDPATSLPFVPTDLPPVDPPPSTPGVAPTPSPLPPTPPPSPPISGDLLGPDDPPALPATTGGSAGGGAGTGGAGPVPGGGGAAGDAGTAASFTVALEPATLRLRAGERADVEIRLQVRPSLLPVELTLADPLGAQTLATVLEPAVLVVPGGDVRTATLRVGAPAGAAVTTYDLVVRVVRGDTGETQEATLPVEVVADAAAAPSPAAPAAATPATPAAVEAERPPETQTGAAPNVVGRGALAAAGAVAGAGSASVGLYLLTRRETWRFAVLAMVAGVLARRLFDAKLREKVLDAVRKRPGITYGELRRATGAGRLRLVATLRALQGTRAVKADRKGTTWSFSLPVSEQPFPKKPTW